jgi:subtilase family serine protease
MRLVLALPLRNEKALDKFLKDLYDPASPSYHTFLTVAQFTDSFGPSQGDYDSVVHFAEANGFTVVGKSPNRLNVDVIGSVAVIESAFHVKMGAYTHPIENRDFYAPDREPTVDLPFSLWHISGLDNYSIPHPAGLELNPSPKPNATTGSGPSASFLGSDMRAAYYGGSILNGSGQTLGLLEYYGTDLNDLNTYFQNAGQTNNVPVILESTDGTSTGCFFGCDDTEQTLDMTQALGMAPGLSSLIVYIGSSDAAIFNAMATASPLDAQLSSSWTWSPADPSTDNPYFKEFAAQGQNLFQAAGDSGAWTRSSTIFPADDPYLVSVGGTDLQTGSPAGPWSSETVWIDGGGGISPDGFAIPSWQVATANNCSNCSKTSRNAPDVSANANFTFYVCANQSGCTANSYGGTSFAAPMWAGYLALVNQQAVANGGSPVGFLNPALYSIGASSGYTADFHDVTDGSNGYSATTGYDLATGWGSPNGSGLINALVAPPSPSFTLSRSSPGVTITQGGASGTDTITINPSGGFTGNVTLSASGLPSGVSATFGTNPATSSSVLSLTASSTAATGTVTVTIAGVSGSIQQTTTISLTVNPASSPSFTLSASPGSVSVTRGSQGTSTITINPSNGFNSSVTLSASGLPSGVSASFGTNPATSSSPLTLTASSSAATGTVTVTITGVSGSIQQSTTVSLTVNPASTPGFTISASPGTVSVGTSSQATTTITIFPSGGFTGAVKLSATGMGRGTTASFSPNPTTNNSVLTFTTSSLSFPGTHKITVTGVSGKLRSTTPVSLQVHK